MKNAGTTIGMIAIAFGLAFIGVNLDGNRADATPAAFAPAGDPAEPTIVWYDSTTRHEECNDVVDIIRAWSDGTVERRVVTIQTRTQNGCGCGDPVVGEGASCENAVGWVVISSPNEGLNARADLNLDARVDAADLGMVLAAWGDAPRNDLPPSDCPLGLIP